MTCGGRSWAGPERGSEILCVLTHGMGSTPPPPPLVQETNCCKKRKIYSLCGWTTRCNAAHQPTYNCGKCKRASLGTYKKKKVTLQRHSWPVEVGLIDLNDGVIYTAFVFLAKMPVLTRKLPRNFLRFFRISSSTAAIFPNVCLM